MLGVQEDKLTVLIHAAGSQERWEGPFPKQMTVVHGETIIGRVFRNISSRGHIPILVTHREDISSCQPGIRWVPDKHDLHIETLLSSKPLWIGQITVLFGDTLYTQKAYAEILACRAPYWFFGNASQLFGMSFNDYGLIEDAIKQLLASITPRGRLIDLYRLLAGLNLTQHELGLCYDYWEDPIRDIDKPDELETIRYTYLKDVWG